MVSDHDPACMQGIVVITLNAATTVRGSLRAHGVVTPVDGREPSRQLDFVYDAVAQQWRGRFETTYGPMEWWLRIGDGGWLIGSLVQLPSLHINRILRASHPESGH